MSLGALDVKRHMTMTLTSNCGANCNNSAGAIVRADCGERLK